MGRPKKPRHLKAIAGTLQKCRDGETPKGEQPALGRVEFAQAAPDWLSTTFARKEWDRLQPMLVGAGVLAPADLGPLGVLCEIYGQIVDAGTRRNPITASLVSQYRGLCSEFGITPVSRQRVRGGDVPSTPANRFGTIGRKPA